MEIHYGEEPAPLRQFEELDVAERFHVLAPAVLGDVPSSRAARAMIKMVGTSQQELRVASAKRVFKLSRQWRKDTQLCEPRPSMAQACKELRVDQTSVLAHIVEVAQQIHPNLSF